MPHLLERVFHRHDTADDEASSPYLDIDDFDADAVREMETEYIRLGYMAEADRMHIPGSTSPH